MVSGGVIWIAWPVIAGLVVFWQVRRHARWPQIFGAVALATYAWWICSVAFFPLPVRESGAASAGEFAALGWVNLVSFTLFGPLLWPRLRTRWWPLAAGLGGSLAIELIQLALSGAVGYPYRQTDVDDVIPNALGAFLGYVVFLAVRALGRRLTRRAAAGVSRE